MRWEALRVGGRPGPFRPNHRYENPRAYGDLANIGNVPELREYHRELVVTDAGEYGYDLYYFRRMAECRAVDVLQADATRCAGITGFLQVGALCDAYNLPLSSHTASSLHVHPCCAVARVRHVEHDVVVVHRDERGALLGFDAGEVLSGHVRSFAVFAARGRRQRVPA